MENAGKIKITVRQSNGEQFEVEILPNAEVLELKKACEDKSGMAAADMRLIHKGKILKDEQPLSEYKITDGLTVHLVKGKSSAPAGGSQPAASTTTSSPNPSSAPTGAPNMSTGQPQPCSRNSGATSRMRKGICWNGTRNCLHE